MISASVINAAPKEVILNGERYIMRPLRDVDYAALEAWMQDRVIDVVRRNVKGLEPEIQRKLLQEAFDKASALQMGSDGAMKVLATPDGCLRLLWYALRQDHPDLLLADIPALVASPEAIKYAMQAMEDMERRATPKLPKFQSGSRRSRRRSRKRNRKRRE